MVSLPTNKQILQIPGIVYPDISFIFQKIVHIDVPVLLPELICQLRRQSMRIVTDHSGGMYPEGLWRSDCHLAEIQRPVAFS